LCRVGDPYHYRFWPKNYLQHNQAFTYDELIQRDQFSLDIFRLKDESLEDSENLPAPDLLAKDIVESLQAALEQFASIAEDLGRDTEVGEVAAQAADRG
jgi:hypothetical protein